MMVLVTFNILVQQKSLILLYENVHAKKEMLRTE